MIDYNLLVKKAFEARKLAYAPYSKWLVGAALLCKDGEIYTGCNIENFGFSSTVCGERTAIFKAVSEGKKDFSAIAIVGGDSKEGVKGFCYPCGVCRQVMSEFCDPDSFEIIVASSEDCYKVHKLRELLPNGGFVVSNSDEGTSFYFG